MQDVMSTLEKVKSLANSRRFWALAAQTAVSLIVLAAMIMPLLGLDPPDAPDEAELTDRLAQMGERVAGILGAVMTLLALGASTKETIGSYTVRPPGVADRQGTLVIYTEESAAQVGGDMSGGIQAGGDMSAGGDVASAGRDIHK